MLRPSLLLSLGLLAPTVSATNDYTLDMPTTVGLGDVYETCMTAPVDSYSLLLLSAGDGPTPTKFGILSLDVPFLFSVLIPLQGGVPFCFDHLIHCDPALVDLELHLQFIAVGVQDPSVRGLSNPAKITIEDDECISPGDFVSFTMGGWGTNCSGNNPGCLRDAFFSSVFPAGMTIGDQDGPDADASYSILLTTSAAVANFLPNGGPSKVLKADAVNPASSAAGNVAGQLTAASLSLGFDDWGAFDGIKNQPDVKLGDLRFAAGCVASGLAGKSVRDVIGAAHDLIGGPAGATVDLGDGPVTLGELAAALDTLNNNFVDGAQDLGCLELP